MAKPAKSPLKKKPSGLFTWILLTCLVQVCIYARSVSVGILQTRRKMYNLTVPQTLKKSAKQMETKTSKEVVHVEERYNMILFSFERLPRFLFQYRIS